VSARVAILAGVPLALASLPGCALFRPPAGGELEVTATAYNSLPGQAADRRDPARSASGAELRPGMRVLAVSDDLFEDGLRFGARVWIEGVAGEWRVEDRMAPRWRQRIDVYMGDDRTAAERFGERRVRIRWRPPP
jgi:3D (Asp-Asp-Asp) domain-containing protein